MMERFQKPKKKGGINSAFSEAIAQVMKEIPDQRGKNGKPFTFGAWCAVLRGIPPEFIIDMLHKAKKSTNTGKHFNWQVKEFKKSCNHTG